MESMMIIRDYNQLKALSDPFRVKLMLRLVESPFTGQQLSEVFDLSRARIHYHLRELEKLGLIEIVKTEEKNGIIQKFYQSVASGFYPDASLMPHKEEISNTKRQMLYGMLDRTMTRLLEAPNDAFEEAGPNDPADWNILATSWETKVTEENFRWYTKKYFELLEELQNRAEKDADNPDAKYYYMSGYGFQVNESNFEKRVSNTDENE
ncbi:winged helix-turn-helix transcriptional regulator [Rossellomorea vietnamensis]|uniref:Winged helix-turn-helix transcriptional regulator n=2 Tax=Rossellomorea vietnamensis TaxID=218284 RepID=A0A5D4NJ26_9BACI|nr:winged helix-turn-helix transcriptional regulator [Rossellomorea vietnamensis]